MNTKYNLDLVFETTGGSDCRWRLTDVRSDIASVYAPLVQGIIASGAFDTGGKGDLVSLIEGKLEEVTSNVVVVTR